MVAGMAESVEYGMPLVLSGRPHAYYDRTVADLALITPADFYTRHHHHPVQPQVNSNILHFWLPMLHLQLAIFRIADQTILSQPVLNNDLPWNWLNKVPNKNADQRLGYRRAGCHR